MRFKSVFAYLAVSLVAVTSALAQGDKTKTPVVQLPKAAVKVITPAGTKQALPALTQAQIDIVKAGRVSFAASWGLTITQANLKPSFWVTPQAAAHANGATLGVLSTSDVGISFGATAVFPYGNVPLRSSVAGTDYLGVSNVPATARDWFLVECLVTAGGGYAMSSPQPGPGGRATGAADVMYRDLTSNGTKVAALFAPTTQARRSFEVHRFGADFGDWRSGGCEVTPIQL